MARTTIPEICPPGEGMILWCKTGWWADTVWRLTFFNRI